MVEQNQFVEFFSDFIPTIVNSSFFRKVTQPDLTRANPSSLNFLAIFLFSQVQMEIYQK